MNVDSNKKIKQKRHQPCCYYPTTVLFLDDDREHLATMDISLNPKLPCKYYDNPTNALEFLNNQYAAPNFLEQCINAENSDDLDRPGSNKNYVSINVGAIHQHIYNKERFNEISVIIIDYSMHVLNGIDFAKQLSNTSIKKIMLTGKADYRIAVNAFNEGAIDCFLTKDDPDLPQSIEHAIFTFQNEYFQDITTNIVNSISRDATCLHDKVFFDFFRNLCEQNKICEYYLIDSCGSFLLLNEDGNFSFLIVKSDRELKEYHDIAVGNHAPSIVVEELKSRKKIPFFFSDEDYNEPVQTWERYLHAASHLEGLDGFYWAYISQPGHYIIDRIKILPYKQYLSKLPPPF